MASLFFRFTIAATVILLPHVIRAEDDAHDKLVYSGYSKSLQPSGVKVLVTRSLIDMKTTQLDRPATNEDVKAGRAVFTFEGLGETRIWKLPEPKLSAEWPALSTPQSICSGWVCQAEELNVGGKWKRYFGFVCQRGAAVVPADEIELRWDDAPWHPREQTFADMFMGVTVPGPKPGFWKRQKDESPKVGDPLPIELYLSNTKDRVFTVPANWCKLAKDGAPTAAGTVAVSLEWAPFDPKRPVLPEFVRLAPIAKIRFSSNNKMISLNLGDSAKILAFDLREAFKVERQGYYNVALEVDWEALGLREQGTTGPVLGRSFTIGKEPRLPTIEEFNKTQAVLGGEENEERLRRVIKQTVVPTHPVIKPLPADVAGLLKWSEPVNGLVARVEMVGTSWGGGVDILVRLKNVSQRAITVPGGNPYDKEVPKPFEIRVRQGDGSWRAIEPDWDRYLVPLKDVRTTAFFSGNLRRLGKPAGRPSIVLKPGEQGIATVRGRDVHGEGLAKEYKVVMRQAPVGRAESWIGVLETPAYFSKRSSEDLAEMRAGTLPMPEHFPAFSYGRAAINSSGHEAAVEAMRHWNWQLFRALKLYDAASVRLEFERRMRAEKQLAAKLLYAVIAASAGSEEAALLILDTLRATDYRTRVNVHAALCELFPSSGAKPPSWVVELSIAALSDERFATGLEQANFGRGTAFPLATCETRNLEYRLCEAKCYEAVPVLIQRLKKCNSFSSASLLAAMGDKRLIPVFMERAEKAATVAGSAAGNEISFEFRDAADALAKLQAHEAVPLFLGYVEFPEIISDLGEMSDPRAAPVLLEIVSKHGKIVRNGRDLRPELADKRLYAANVTLAQLDSINGVHHLGKMLGDQSLSVDQRYDVLIDLARLNDPRAIPYMENVIKAECSVRPNEKEFTRPFLIYMAIDDLGEFKSKAAVQALIECFDLKYQEEELGKGERATPETYRNRIAMSLQRITGQTFGAEKQQWLKWWREKGQQSTELK